MERLGTLLVVSGPSGVGKSSIYNFIVRRTRDIEFSTSCTTRCPRICEQDGSDYHFIYIEDFNEKLANNEFIEYAKVHGNYYGTLKKEITERISNGIDVVLDIDVQGATQIKEIAKTDPLLEKCTKYIFITPPTLEDLKIRLEERNTESNEDIQERLSNAEKEMSFAEQYDYVIVNDEITKARQEFKDIIMNLRDKEK